MKKLLRFGHRGAPGYPRLGENTLPSFRKAFESGADGVETDVRKTKDGILVLLHDQAINRTTNGKGSVNNFTYEELCKFKTDNDSYIPTLEEFLKEFGNRDKLLFLELKEGGIAQQVKELISKFNLIESTIVVSFDEDDQKPDASSSWDYLRIFPPEIKIGLITSQRKTERLGKEGFIKIARGLNAYSIQPVHDVIESSPFIDLVEMAHATGLWVFTWTINKAEDIRKAERISVDGIFSDLPELLS